LSNDNGAVEPKNNKTEKPSLQLPVGIDPSIAEQLVEQARADGVDLVGPKGLLGQLTKQILETGLEVEMDEHLGYAKHDPADREAGSNSRNGTR
jgi:hypothetical protein